MPHLHRFYVAELPEGSTAAVLVDQEAHHALHVVRAKVGEQVAIFDGCGHEWRGEVSATTRHEVHVALSEPRFRPPYNLTLVQSWLHRDKAVEELIRHGTEIGVARFVFFSAHHSERTPRLNDKWMKTAIEACKQCGRPWLPEFFVAKDLESALAEASGVLLLATRDLDPQPIDRCITAPEISLLIGPEGDFTEQELATVVASGAKPVSLGNVTYRAEVAAFVGATIVLYELARRIAK